MLSINYPRTYAQTGEIAAFRPTRRPSRDAVISVSNGRFALDGELFPIFFTPLVEGAAVPKVDAELIATLKRIVADGYNGLYLRDITGRKWTESSTNWGVWEYDNNDASYTNRWSMVEAALVQVDKMVAYALDYGIECVCIDLEGYDEIVLRHPNQRAIGTYQGRGMWWSSEYRQMAWDVNSRIFTRTSTITGIRHCDNPRVIWKFANENGFGDAATRGTTSNFEGSTTTWMAKIVDGTGTNNNGYWYTELNAKLVAWRDANAPTWTIPAWGRGSSGVADGAVGFPKRETWFNWATGASPATDQARFIDFVDAMDYEAACDLITRCRAENPAVVINVGTQHYHSPRANFALPADLSTNLFAETHQYFNDNGGVGVKTGTATSRRSCIDPTWTTVLNGMGWIDATGATRSQDTAFVASECGQYSPNRWRYQRMYYEMLFAQLHGYDTSDFNQAQQYSSYQFVNDGRYPMGDHVTVGSPCLRLTARAVSVPLRLGFLTEHTSSFVVQSRPSDIATYQYANKTVGVQGGLKCMNPTPTDGTQNFVYSQYKVYWNIDAAATPTTDFSPVKVLHATLAAGTFLRNTATEKVYIKRPEGVQLMTPYMCGFIDTLQEKAAADAIFTMPLYLSSMLASVSCAVCFLRSDGLYPLFTGPMKLYIHGSDFSDEVVLQGSDYAQHAADALGAHNPPGEAYFMANDQVTMYYAGASSQSWGNGSGSPATCRLMMPESFTLNLDTTNAGALPGTDLEIFGVGTNGIPVRLSSSYNTGSKLWSFNYTGVYPEYIVQPKVSTATLLQYEQV